ncbi:MAG: response regulator [Haloglomus sp.]
MTDSDATVLVVDDDEDLADTFEVWLEQAGYEALTAYGGDEALARFDPEMDVVLLDRRMPHVPGDEVLRELREREGDQQVSMLTAVEPQADVLDLPFDEYLTKPVSRQDLLDAVERLRDRQSLDAEMQELFRLTSKLGALEAGTSEDVAAARDELESRIEEQEARVDEYLQEFDDHAEAFAVLQETE